MELIITKKTDKTKLKRIRHMTMKTNYNYFVDGTR